MMNYTMSDRRESFRNWYRTVTFDDGRVFVVGVERGKPVRIPFKPRGQNRGFQWWGVVRDATGRTVWTDRLSSGTVGVRGLLMRAGLLTSKKETTT